LRRALELYPLKQYLEMGDLLRFCLTRLEERQKELLVSFFPAPPEEFQATKPTVTSLPGGGQMASQEYLHLSGSPVLVLEMSLDSPLIEAMAEAFVDRRRAGENGQLLTIRKYRALAEFDAKERKGKITLLLKDRLLIIAKGTNISDLTEVEKLIASLDLERMESIFLSG